MTHFRQTEVVSAAVSDGGWQFFLKLVEIESAESSSPAKTPPNSYYQTVITSLIIDYCS